VRKFSTTFRGNNDGREPFFWALNFAAGFAAGLSVKRN